MAVQENIISTKQEQDAIQKKLCNYKKIKPKKNPWRKYGVKLWPLKLEFSIER